jgi:archaemetzincin
MPQQPRLTISALARVVVQLCCVAAAALLWTSGCHQNHSEAGRQAAAATAAQPARSVPAPPQAQPSVVAHPAASQSALPTDAATQPEPALRVYVQPLGAELPNASVDFVRTSLLAFYELEVLVLDRVELPAWALNRTKTRYRAEKLLELLEQRLPRGGFRILGLTCSDISTTKGKFADWGILGLATIDGRACVISTFRTRRQAKSAEHARIRLGKTAVHEIGHTLGLGHCPNQGCLMQDARGTVLTTDGEYDLCEDCRAELVRRGHRLASSEIPIPWPRP